MDQIGYFNLLQEIQQNFEEQMLDQSLNISRLNDDEELDFQTKVIFTLADYLQTLSPTEYYDIAQIL